jgi:hypothetical protein
MAKTDTAAAGNTDDNNFQGVGSSESGGYAFDMSAVDEDQGFPVAPAGVYDLAVDSLDFGQSQTSGNDMWTIRFLITGGESDPSGEVAGKNIKFRHYQVFSVDQRGRAKRMLSCMGRDDLANDQNFDPKKVADDKILVGTSVRARLNVRKSAEYGDQNQVAQFLPAAAAGGGDGGFRM